MEVLLDLSESTISGYTNYSVEVFSKCLHVIQQELIKAQCNEATEETLEQAITRMSGEFSSLPKYRYESKLYKSQQIYYNLFMYFIVLSPGCRDPFGSSEFKEESRVKRPKSHQKAWQNKECDEAREQNGHALVPKIKHRSHVKEMWRKGRREMENCSKKG